MDKYKKAKNTQNIFFQRISQFPNPLFPEKIIIDKGELIIDKEEEILSLR